ncbi:unnamed protein product [Acanthocheilonema viteae]|uniref:Uncharacterized protein n=1 Tax=Acanthocheilonema viteae TaxID=6277 RepID=A0A498S9H8_ACAVI|nr:unnamed protein product [Acanthocheilonema viteae]
MTDNIILVILLLNGIICEAQYHNCFMSGGISGRSTWCGENSKDEENLKDPVEIMKRAKEFLEKQNKIILDPMTWTLAITTPPPSISVSPVINATSAATVSGPMLVAQPGITEARAQSSYIPLYSVALPGDANSLPTPISKDPSNLSNLQLLPFVGILSPENSRGLQNDLISTGQANFPYRLANSEQISRLQQQFRNQANYMVNKENEASNTINKVNEIPRLLKIPPSPSTPKFFAEEQNLKLKENNDLTDMSSIKPISCVTTFHATAI